METRLQRRRRQAREALGPPDYLTLVECRVRYLPDEYDSDDFHRRIKLRRELKGLTEYPLYELRLLKQMDRPYCKKMFKIQSKHRREAEIRMLMDRENESQTEYVLK